METAACAGHSTFDEGNDVTQRHESGEARCPASPPLLTGLLLALRLPFRCGDGVLGVFLAPLLKSDTQGHAPHESSPCVLSDVVVSRIRSWRSAFSKRSCIYTHDTCVLGGCFRVFFCSPCATFSALCALSHPRHCSVCGVIHPQLLTIGSCLLGAVYSAHEGSDRTEMNKACSLGCTSGGTSLLVGPHPNNSPDTPVVLGLS